MKLQNFYKGILKTFEWY